MALKAWGLIVAVVFAGTQAVAELQSLFPRETQPVLARLVPDATRPALTRSTSGMFSRKANIGFFAPLPKRTIQLRGLPNRHGTQIANLLSLIASAEAGSAGYDAVQHGAPIRPRKLPTQLTLGQIFAWIKATPGQPHAIGRYQFIPATLRRLVMIKDLGPNTPFSPDVQDALALVLLEEQGLREFQVGQLARKDFMKNLAKVWAGLPLPSGKSYYQGYAGNAATMTWAAFKTGMARIFPA